MLCLALGNGVQRIGAPERRLPGSIRPRLEISGWVKDHWDVEAGVARRTQRTGLPFLNHESVCGGGNALEVDVAQGSAANLPSCIDEDLPVSQPTLRPSCCANPAQPLPGLVTSIDVRLFPAVPRHFPSNAALHSMPE
jgi:hypothetical protein